MHIALGATYQDLVTGFKGIATGYVQYLTGCNQVLLVPKVGTDGKPVDAAWFDVQRVQRDESKLQISLDNGATPGPDRAAPKR